jgi:hypothetical protein
MANHTKSAGSNVNVTLGPAQNASKSTFPCPLCNAALELRESRVRKPYAVCNSCGIQIFFRGKNAISRLKELNSNGKLPVGVPAGGNTASIAFARLEQLRAQKKQLEQKRPFVLADKDLENAISAVEKEIAKSQTALAALASRGDLK